MKILSKILFSFIIGLVLIPSVSYATPTSWDYASNILQPLKSMWSKEVRVSRITATSTTEASVFPLLSASSSTSTDLAVTDSFNFLGSVITNVSTWFSGLFDTNFSSSTAVLTELPNLSSVGTIATGTWNGTPIGTSYGGTGTSTTPSTGDIMVALSDGTYGPKATSTLAINTDDTVEGSTNLFWTVARFVTELLNGHDAILGNATTTNLIVTGTTTTAQLNFDTTASGAVAEGEMRWNDTYHTLDIGVCNDPEVTLQVGQELHKLVVNKTGSTITNGTPVYITGSQGNRPTVAPTDITGSDSSNFIGMATADIANNAEGCITLAGDVHGLALNPATYTEGDRIYLSEPAGTFSNVHPATSTDAVVVIGEVTNAHITQGSIDIAPLRFSIGNDYNGTLRESIKNNSASSSAITSMSSINNINEYISLAILGSGYTGTGDYGNSDTSIFSSGAGELRIINDGNKDIEFWTDHTDTRNIISNTEKAVITGAGLFGVGTSTPAAQITASTTNNTGLIIDQRGTSNIVDFQDSGSSVFTVADGGNVSMTNFSATSGTTTNFSVTGMFNFLGTAITDVATWFNGLFDTQLATKTTNDLTEGTTNLYNQTHTGEVIGATSTVVADNVIDVNNLKISGTVDGYVLTASSTAEGGFAWNTAGGSGTVTSVAATVPSGWTISGSPITGAGTLTFNYAAGYGPVLTASTTEWATAYGWGDHSLAGYLTGNETITLSGDITGSGTTSITTTLSSTTGTTINGFTAKTTLADNDLFALVDSAASNVLKKFTWSNILVAIGTWLQSVTGYADGYVLTASTTATYGIAWTQVSGNSSVASSTVFTTNGTFNVPGTFNYLVVEVQGAGGNGGASAGGTNNGGGGGGGGGYVKKILTPTDLSGTSTIAVTIGTAGIGSGFTAFSSFVTAGNGANGDTGPGGAGAGGNATGGDINIAGQPGQSPGGSAYAGGKGGDSFYGFGGAAAQISTNTSIANNGQSAGGFGGGGGGGSGASDGSPTGTGGSATAGIVIVTVY